MNECKPLQVGQRDSEAVHREGRPERGGPERRPRRRPRQRRRRRRAALQRRRRCQGEAREPPLPLVGPARLSPPSSENEGTKSEEQTGALLVAPSLNTACTIRTAGMTLETQETRSYKSLDDVASNIDMTQDTQETRVHKALDDMTSNIDMTQETHEMRVHKALDDQASNISEALLGGASPTCACPGICTAPPVWSSACAAGAHTRSLQRSTSGPSGHIAPVRAQHKHLRTSGHIHGLIWVIWGAKSV